MEIFIFCKNNCFYMQKQYFLQILMFLYRNHSFLQKTPGGAAVRAQGSLSQFFPFPHSLSRTRHRTIEKLCFVLQTFLDANPGGGGRQGMGGSWIIEKNEKLKPPQNMTENYRKAMFRVSNLVNQDRKPFEQSRRGGKPPCHFSYSSHLRSKTKLCKPLSLF